MSSAKKLLPRKRVSKADWGQDDLHTLLTGFGFELTEGGNHRLYEHPLLPDWHVTIARHKPLAKGYVVSAIKAIDALQAKQRKESNRGE